MEIKFTDKAFKQLEKIAKGDKRSAKRIIEKIENYAENKNGNYDIKVLKNKLGDRKRLRIGDYRIIFKIEGSNMIISIIKQRQGAYDD